MDEKIKVFIGKLGHEEWLMDITINKNNYSLNKGNLIVLPRENADDIYDSDVYVIKQVMIDIVHNEISLFVELYKWED